MPPTVRTRPCARPELSGLRGWALVAVVATSLAVPVARAQDPAPAAVAQGGTVYQQNCAACHGSSGEGRTGTGVEAGPSLVGLPLALVDLVVRTGRMPIARPQVGVLESRLTADERAALVAWGRRELDLAGDLPSIPPGDPSRGQQIYGAYCAACHGATAGGGVAGDATLVPPLIGLDAVAVGEAIRTGPFSMPVFDPALITDQDVGDITSFLERIRASETTPLGLREVSAGAAAGLVLLLVVPVVVGAAVLGAAFRRRRDPGQEKAR